MRAAAQVLGNLAAKYVATGLKMACFKHRPPIWLPPRTRAHLRAALAMEARASSVESIDLSFTS
jgi:hypothetical protein